jgi:hypothetical protein
LFAFTKFVVAVATLHQCLSSSPRKCGSSPDLFVLRLTFPSTPHHIIDASFLLPLRSLFSLSAVQQIQWATSSPFVLPLLSLVCLYLRFLISTAMAVFQDLEEDPEPPEIIPSQWQHLLERGLRTAHIGTLDGQDDGRVNPNKNVMTEALGCYPYAQQVFFLSCYVS